MALKVPSVEMVAGRWAAGMFRHAWRTTLGVDCVACPKKGIWAATSRIRAVTRRSKHNLCVSIPKVMRSQMGISEGDYVEFVPGRGGEIVIRKASERKVRAALNRFEHFRVKVPHEVKPWPRVGETR